MARIATLTMNPCLDVTALVERVVPDRKLRCHDVRRFPGGGGINVARAVHRLGGRALALYPAGGALGELLGELLTEEEDVEWRRIRIGGHTRQSLMVRETKSDVQFRFGFPGPELEAEEWRRCLQELAELNPLPDYLVVSGSLPPGVPVDFYARVVRAARERGTRVIVDTSGDALQAAAREGPFALKPNLRELQQLTGQPLRSEGQQEAAARRICGRHDCSGVILSLGAAGALVVSPQGRRRWRAPTVPIISKVGAGDSMVAGMVLALSRGEPLELAAAHGVAAGAAAVMTAGTELCRREDFEELRDAILSEQDEPQASGQH